MSRYADVDALLAWYDERRAEARYRLMDGRRRSVRQEARTEISLLDQMYFRICKLTERPSDVQEVKHGKWIKNKENGYYECSNCKSTKPYDGISEENPDSVIYWNCDYCRICGAKMDKEKEK